MKISLFIVAVALKKMTKIWVASIAAVVALGSGFVISYITYVPPMPEIDTDTWWGIGQKPKEQDTSIRHFTVDFNNTMINDLKQRLRNRRPLTKPLEGIASEYGINTIYLDQVMTYWVEKYDFKGRAELLNKFPHFKTRIQGLDIHFIHKKPDVKKDTKLKVLPLLMLHGWPSSSKEFDKVIPMLTTPRENYDVVFEVVAADLPGFGFSEGTTKPGLSPVEIGIMMRNLMKRLGFDKFYIQAGDWGSQCASHITTLFPDEVLGFHTNMPLSGRKISNIKFLIGALFPTLVDSSYSHRIYPLSEYFSKLLRESGYFHLQATKPDTIGAALTDSPVGLASYLMEKMAICSSTDQLDTLHGGLENLNLDDVLDTVTIVWANNCITTATRIYYEAMRSKRSIIEVLHNIPTPVPTAAVKFRYEVVYQPDWLLRDKFPNLVRSIVYDFGGHFAALQTPSVLADDIFDSAVKFLEFHERKSAQDEARCKWCY